MTVADSGFEAYINIMAAIPIFLIVGLFFIAGVLSVAGRIRNQVAFNRFWELEAMAPPEVSMARRGKRGGRKRRKLGSEKVLATPQHSQERVLGAVIFDGEVRCVECMPLSIPLDSQEVALITHDSGWTVPPICSCCGHSHEDLVEKAA